jgi:hypothetical protein
MVLDSSVMNVSISQIVADLDTTTGWARCSVAGGAVAGTIAP